MLRKKIITKRFVSPDGRVISEATSVSVVSCSSDESGTDTDDQTETITQIVTATVSSGGSQASSSSSSRCASSDR